MILSIPFSPTAGQRRFLESPQFIRLAISGVGGGKSTVGAVAAWEMCAMNGAPRVSSDDARAMIVAPTYDMLRLNTLLPVRKWWPRESVANWQSLERLCAASRIAGPFDLQMVNGFTWHFRSGDDPDHLRGPNLCGAWLDEAGQMDSYVWDVIQGRVRVKCPRSFLNLTTTPAGYNWLYSEFGTEPMKPNREVIGWDARDNAANQAKGFYQNLESSYHPQLFAQEVCGLFVDVNAFAYLNQDAIVACEADDCPRWTDGAETYIGVDIGHKADLTVIWYWQHVAGRLQTAKIVELGPDSPMPVHEESVRDACRTRNAARVCIDATGKGAGIASNMEWEFPGLVEAVTFTAPRKELMASRLKQAIERHVVSLPKSAKIRNDLLSVQRDWTAKGNPQLSAPRKEGSHADRFWAAALGCEAAGDWVLTGGQPMELSFA